MAKLADNLTKLQEYVSESRRKLEPFRNSRITALKQYAGPHYGQDQQRNSLSVNMLELAIDIYTQQLAVTNPQILATTSVRDLNRPAELLQLALNQLLQAIDFGSTMLGVIVEALFSVGFVKVGVTAAEEHELAGFEHDADRPFADVVTLDDMVFDMRARRWEEVEFVGNQFRWHVDDVLNHERFDKEVRQRARSSSYDRMHGDAGKDRAEDLSQGRDRSLAKGYDDEMVSLWEIWIPRQQRLVTYLEDGGGRPLANEEWAGPRHGPYHILGYKFVPGNVMPLPPVSNLMDMSDLTGRVYNKLGKQANEQKTVIGAAGSAAEDASRVIKAGDMEVVMVNHPQGLQPMRFNGPDAQLLAFGANLRGLFSYMAGNLDTLGGLSSQSGTLGQEQLLAQSSNQRIRQMQSAVSKFTRSVVKDLGWYEWHNDMAPLPVVEKIPRTELEVHSQWPRQRGVLGEEVDLRKGDFDQYAIRMTPYSYQEQTPAQRLQMVRQIWQQDVMPMAQMLMMQGATPNIIEYLRIIAGYGDLPELDRMIETGERLLPQGGGMTNGRMAKPASTTRNYVRRQAQASELEQSEKALQRAGRNGSA